MALVPLLDVVYRSNPKEAWKAGYLFGIVFCLGELHWLAQLTQVWTHSFWLGLVPWLLATAAMACYYGLFCLLAQRCFERKRFGWIPIVWAGIEVFRTYIPVLAFPWALVATPLWRYPALIQTAHLGTIYLISAWVVAINLCVALMLKERDLLKVVGRLAIACSVQLAISIGLYLVPLPATRARVTLGQLGLDMAFSPSAVIQAKTPALVRDYQEVARHDHSDLLVLSEGIASAEDDRHFFPFDLDPRIPTLFGGQRQESVGAYYQSAIGFDGTWHHADKTRLVIFGEFVPGRDFLPFLKAFGLPGGDISAGKTGVQEIPLGRLTVGPLLCFEGLFPDLSYRQALNNTDLIAVMSDDDWFMGSSAPEQLRIAAIWRAVETGMSVVRVGSLGHTLAVDRKGRPIISLPLRRQVAKTVDVPVSKASPWLVLLPAFPACSLALCLVCLVPTRKSPQEAISVPKKPNQTV